MEKLIYVTFVDYKEKSFLGVIKKINYQIRSFRKAGMEVVLLGQYGKDAVIIRNDGSQSIIPNGGKSKRRLIADTAEKLTAEEKFDYTYVRFQFFCNNVARMLRKMKKQGVKVLMEIPTYPYVSELKMQGARGIPKLICDRFFRGMCCKSIDQLAVSGSEKEVYGLPAFTMRNGLCIEDIKLSEYTYSKNRLDIISVSSMMPWHGLDRIMEGMAEYYARGGERDVILHAVGDGRFRSRYEAQAKELGLSDKVIFYGALFGEQLDEVFDKCCVGVCILKSHSANEGTPLKTVEYVARGLAIVTEMKLWFLGEKSEFCLKKSRDDSPLDIDEVIGFCDGLFGDDCQQAKERIRALAEEKCDVSVSMKPAIDFYRK